MAIDRPPRGVYVIHWRHGWFRIRSAEGGEMVRGLVLAVGLAGGVVWEVWPFDSLDQGRWVVWRGNQEIIQPFYMEWDPGEALPPSAEFDRLVRLVGGIYRFRLSYIEEKDPYPFGAFYMPSKVHVGVGRYWEGRGITLEYRQRHWFYGREDLLGRSRVYWGVIGNLAVEGWCRVGMWKGFSCWVRGGLLRRMGYMAREELQKEETYEAVGVRGWGSVGGVRVVFSPVPWAGLYAGVLGRLMWAGSGRKYYPWNVDGDYGIVLWWKGWRDVD